MYDRITRSALRYLDLNAGMVLPILSDQLCKEASGDEGMDAYAQATTFSHRRHAGRLHGAVQLIDAGRYPLDEVASCLGQPDAACVTFEEEDVEVFLKRL